MNADTLDQLRKILAELPEGTTSDVNASDLEAGNFETTCLEIPDERFKHPTIAFLYYYGPIADGYVSPFEQSEEII